MTPNPIFTPVDAADSMLAEVCRSNDDRLASAVQLPDGVKIKYRLTLTTSMQKERRDAGLSELGSAGNVELAAAGETVA